MIPLASWHHRFPGQVAGSVYAAADRARAGRAFADAGLDVHVDMMATDEGLPQGVSVGEVRELAKTVDRSRIGVHLIGSAAFVDAVLPDVLAVQPAKVFLPWHAFTDDRISAAHAVGSAAWIVVWDEWDGNGSPAWPAPPDGALVMLIEPGTAGTCRLGQLAVVAACAAELPVNVDGGVTEHAAPLCITAGAESMVVGRALLATSPSERKAG